MVTKITGVHIKQGQRVRLESPGGGGYGSPSERSADDIRRDVALGYISAKAARETYGVAVGDDA